MRADVPLRIGDNREILTMEWVTIIAAIAAIAACIAAWYAARSSKIAKQAYQLSLEQDLRQRPSLDLYLDDSYIKRIEHKDERIFVFRLMITNKSASSNSIKDIQFQIEHQRKEGPLSNISIPHNPGLTDIIHENEKPFEIPFAIAPYSVIRGIAIFNVPNEIIRGSSVECYTIQIVDNKGHLSALEAILIQEIDNEKVAEDRNSNN